MEYTETMDLVGSCAVVNERRKSGSHNAVMEVMVNLEPPRRLEG